MLLAQPSSRKSVTPSLQVTRNRCSWTRWTTLPLTHPVMTPPHWRPWWKTTSLERTSGILPGLSGCKRSALRVSDSRAVQPPQSGAAGQPASPLWLRK